MPEDLLEEGLTILAKAFITALGSRMPS